MAFRTINPATGELVKTVPYWDKEQLEQALSSVAEATGQWSVTSMEQRCLLMRRVAEVIRYRSDELAALITLEMGKLLGEAKAEIEKCALACDYYADHGPQFLADEIIESDASRSLVAYQPLGTVLAVMPWNFPFWQVFRFAAPALVAGNSAILKHASNVPQCAMAIEALFLEAGLPKGVFQTLMISASQVQDVIEDPRVHAVTLTGSEAAGRQVAAIAGACLKKSVLELGGSDAFMVLEDADLELAVQWGIASRYLNCGQSCIAAKRFIVVEAVADEFVARFKAATEALVVGDPMDDSTTLGPMARDDLRNELHQQISDSIASGASAVAGCHSIDREGSYYAASIIDHVRPGMRAWSEELFGPVAIVIRASDEEEALSIANDSPFGLGGSIWSENSERGERFARKLQSGCAFVNGMVKSDPRLPFGGIKASGYGRELSSHGIREFVNAKTIWIK